MLLSIILLLTHFLANGTEIVLQHFDKHWWKGVDAFSLCSEIEQHFERFLFSLFFNWGFIYYLFFNSKEKEKYQSHSSISFNLIIITLIIIKLNSHYALKYNNTLKGFFFF